MSETPRVDKLVLDLCLEDPGVKLTGLKRLAVALEEELSDRNKLIDKMLRDSSRFAKNYEMVPALGEFEKGVVSGMERICALIREIAYRSNKP